MNILKKTLINRHKYEDNKHYPVAYLRTICGQHVSVKNVINFNHYSCGNDKEILPQVISHCFSVYYVRKVHQMKQNMKLV